VFIHEIGHIVDGGYLTGKSNTLSSFIDLGKSVKIDDPSIKYYQISWVNNNKWTENTKTSDFCSRYGSTNPYEDFAECFVYYVLHNPDFLDKTKNSTELEKNTNL